MPKQTAIIIITILVFLIFNCINVKAQGRSGDHRNIPCKDSTPMCPCVLPNGDCFDIDTPIDDELKLLVIAGLFIGLYKLRSIHIAHVK